MNEELVRRSKELLKNWYSALCFNCLWRVCIPFYINEKNVKDKKDLLENYFVLQLVDRVTDDSHPDVRVQMKFGE